MPVEKESSWRFETDDVPVAREEQTLNDAQGCMAPLARQARSFRRRPDFFLLEQSKIWWLAE